LENDGASFVRFRRADSTKGWFNYQAPLTQEITGNRIGDAVRFDHFAATVRERKSEPGVPARRDDRPIRAASASDRLFVVRTGSAGPRDLLPALR
jgi:hypothetical protein